MSFTPNYKPIINNISSDLSVDNDYVYSINNKDKNKIYLSAVENNTTLNNITEYFCVFRTSEDNVIHKAGYTTNLSGNLISGSFLSAKLVEKYPDFYEEIDGEKYYILPEHWSVPDIKNTDIIPCLTHNKYFPLSDEYNKLSVITTIQEKCIGHLLIPLSSDISIDINTILYK